MKIFVTGATGLIGSAVIAELLSAGHSVLGLARSDESARKLTEAGAQVHRGSLTDLESLKSGAGQSDGVIHTAFGHDFSNDFSNFAAMCEQDSAAIEAMGGALEGSERPLIVTSGVALIAPGRVATENDTAHEQAKAFPRRSEAATMELAQRGVRASVIRMSPSVHGEADTQGFIPILIRIAREKGVSAYVGDGQIRWPAVNVADTGALFRLALERGATGAVWHGVADEAIATRQIAEVIGQHLNVPIVSKTPDEATPHFGWIGAMMGLDSPASSAITREKLNWTPTHPGLIADLEQGFYFKN